MTRPGSPPPHTLLECPQLARGDRLSLAVSIVDNLHLEFVSLDGLHGGADDLPLGIFGLRDLQRPHVEPWELLLESAEEVERPMAMWTGLRQEYVEVDSEATVLLELIPLG